MATYRTPGSFNTAQADPSTARGRVPTPKTSTKMNPHQGSKPLEGMTNVCGPKSGTFPRKKIPGSLNPPGVL